MKLPKIISVVLLAIFLACFLRAQETVQAAAPAQSSDRVEKTRSDTRIKSFVWCCSDFKLIRDELLPKVQQWLDENPNIIISDKIHTHAVDRSGKTHYTVTIYYKLG